MKYTREFSIDDFEFYGPAVEVVNRFHEAGELDTLQNIIEDTFGDGELVPTVTQINDFVAYDLPKEIDDILS
jgi:hypothetical protein